jgi:hypothetical protein
VFSDFLSFGRGDIFCPGHFSKNYFSSNFYRSQGNSQISKFYISGAITPWPCLLAGNIIDTIFKIDTLIMTSIKLGSNQFNSFRAEDVFKSYDGQQHVTAKSYVSMMDFLVLIVMVMMECQKPLYVMVLLFLFKDGCGIGMRSQNQKMC